MDTEKQLEWEPEVILLDERKRNGFKKKLDEYKERIEKLRGNPKADERLHTLQTRIDIIDELLEKGSVDLGFWQALHQRTYMTNPSKMGIGKASELDNETMYYLSGSYNWRERIANVIKAYNSGQTSKLRRGTGFGE